MSKIHLDMEQFETGSEKLAYNFAKAGNHMVLQALALAHEAYLFLHRGNPQKANILLDQAYTLAEHEATGKTLGLISITEAEAYSSLQMKKGTYDALERAENAFSHGLQQGDDWNWTSLSQASLSGYKGACLLALHQPEQAREVLNRALLSTPALSIRRRALINVDLAQASIQLQEIEAACESFSVSIECMMQSKSTRALQTIQGGIKLLAPWKKLPRVKQLHEQLKIVQTSSR